MIHCVRVAYTVRRLSLPSASAVCPPWEERYRCIRACRACSLPHPAHPIPLWQPWRYLAVPYLPNSPGTAQRLVVSSRVTQSHSSPIRCADCQCRCIGNGRAVRDWTENFQTREPSGSEAPRANPPLILAPHSRTLFRCSFPSPSPFLLSASSTCSCKATVQYSTKRHHTSGFVARARFP